MIPRSQVRSLPGHTHKGPAEAYCSWGELRQARCRSRAPGIRQPQALGSGNRRDDRPVRQEQDCGQGARAPVVEPRLRGTSSRQAAERRAEARARCRGGRDPGVHVRDGGLVVLHVGVRHCNQSERPASHVGRRRPVRAGRAEAVRRPASGGRPESRFGADIRQDSADQHRLLCAPRYTGDRLRRRRFRGEGVRGRAPRQARRGLAVWRRSRTKHADVSVPPAPPRRSDRGGASDRISGRRDREVPADRRGEGRDRGEHRGRERVQHAAGARSHARRRAGCLASRPPRRWRGQVVLRPGRAGRGSDRRQAAPCQVGALRDHDGSGGCAIRRGFPDGSRRESSSTCTSCRSRRGRSPSRTR